VRSNGPPGINLERAGRRRSKEAAARFVAGPPNSTDAILLPHGLAAVFTGERIEVVDAFSDRPLWRSKTAGARVAFTTAASLWLADGRGKLLERSIRSGREGKTVEIPAGAYAVECFDDPSPPGSRVLVLSKNPEVQVYYGWGSRTQTGTDLFLVKLAADGTKLWEKQLHRGPVTYSGGRLLGEDGRFLLAWNGEDQGEKWYTRVAAIDAKEGAVQDLCSVEVHGKGTGQPPRVAVLKDALAVGNSDGFGWFAPPRNDDGAPRGGLGPAPGGEKNPEKGTQ
jgi:hypothetical protein